MNISHERLKELLDYNEETGVFVWKVYRNQHAKVGDVAGTLDKGYIRIKIDRKLYLAHRLAWLYVNGTFPKLEIDHINRIKNDNRINNLREASRLLNAANKSKHINNSSGVPGIHWNKKAQNWRAEIVVNRKRIRLGTFTSKIEAATARYEAELEHKPTNCHATSPALKFIQSNS